MDFENRIARLEASNRRLKAILACLPLFVVVAGAVAPEVAESLSTKNLFIAGDKGKLCGFFACNDAGDAAVLNCDSIVAREIIVTERLKVQQNDDGAHVALIADNTAGAIICSAPRNASGNGCGVLVRCDSDRAAISVLGKRNGEVMWRAP